MAFMFKQIDPELSSEKYKGMVRDFPDFYNGNGTFLRAIAELVRLSKRHRNKEVIEPCGLELLSQDILNELSSSCLYNAIEHTCKMEIDFGKMSFEDFKELRKNIEDGDIESAINKGDISND